MFAGLHGQLHRTDDDFTAFPDADHAAHGNGADTHRAYEVFEYVAGIHGSQGRQLVQDPVYGHALAEDADHGNQDPPAEERTTGNDQGIAQANDIAQTEHRSFSQHVVFQAHLLADFLAKAKGGRRESFAPEAEGLVTEELERHRDATTLDQHAGLIAAGLADDEHLGRSRRFGEREFAVHVLDEITAERNQQQDTQKATQQGGKAHLPEIRQFVQAQNINARQRKNRASHHHARGRADRLDHDVLLQDVLLAQTRRDANGQDGDGDGRLEHLTDFQAQVGCRGRKDDGKEDTHQEGIACHFGHDARSRHHRHILFTRLQLAISVFGQTPAATADVHEDLHLGVLGERNC